MAKRTIVVFEDLEQRRKQLKISFQRVFSTSAKVVFFEPKALVGNSKVIRAGVKRTYEAQILQYLSEFKIYPDDIALIVTDRDLSTYPEWGGLSEAVVTNFGNMFGIPVCLYAREDSQLQVKIKQILKWSDYKIVLDIGRGSEAFARECKIIYDGFEIIRKKFRKLMGEKSKPKSPSEIMAKIFKKEELQDRISLYGAGDQRVIEDILPYSDDKNTIEKRMPRLFGYWLWDSILRYPGILVYGKAAASYLNIHPSDFKKEEVKELFKKALYTGPFSDIQEYWWRDELDNIIYQEDCSSGNDYAAKLLNRKVRVCKCSVDETLNAGYYCMITREPVSEINSKSNINWFPSGADLARISKTEFDKLAPWIGLY